MEHILLRRRRRRSLLRPFVLSLVIFCLGWTGLWIFARREAGKLIAGWIATEGDRGRAWTCVDQRITGFPLALRVSCATVRLHGRVGGRVVEASLGGLSASVMLYQPNAVDAALTSPLTLVTGESPAPSILAWSSFTLQGRALGAARARAALLLDDPRLDSQGVRNAAAHAELRFAPAAARPREDHAYEVSIKLDAASLPTIDAATGEDARVSVDETGIVTELDPSLPDAWPAAADAWRQAGGRFGFTTFHVVKGDFRGDANGSLGLDEAHRLSGRLEATVSGYAALAQRFGIPPQALTLGSNLLAAVFRRPGAAANEGRPAADPSALTLPLSFADGRVKVGPVTTSQRLLPLY